MSDNRRRKRGTRAQNSPGAGWGWGCAWNPGWEACQSPRAACGSGPAAVGGPPARLTGPSRGRRKIIPSNNNQSRRASCAVLQALCVPLWLLPRACACGASCAARPAGGLACTRRARGGRGPSPPACRRTVRLLPLPPLAAELPSWSLKGATCQAAADALGARCGAARRCAAVVAPPQARTWAAAPLGGRGAAGWVSRACAALQKCLSGRRTRRRGRACACSGIWVRGPRGQATPRARRFFAACGLPIKQGWGVTCTLFAA